MDRFILGAVFFSWLSLAGVAHADSASSDVDVKADSLFVPVGFDDNDEVIAVLDGYLPDPCHRLIKPSVQIDAISGQVQLGARTRKFEADCPPVAVPFTQEVRIGRLTAGTYLVTANDGNLRHIMEIRRGSSKGPDNFLYAPVDNARIEYPGGMRWVAVLEGRFTNSCLSVEQTKVSLEGRSVQVLPIMKYITTEQDGRPCRIVNKLFRVEVELPKLEEDGRYLLHVRSLNGQSVNEVLDRVPHN